MGAWGTKPNENDDYFDLVGEVMATPIAKLDRTLKRKITEKSVHYHGNEWRAAALLVRRMAEAQLYSSDHLLLAHLDFARAKLTCLRDSVEWMKAWDSPAVMRRVLTAELAQVLNLRRKVARRAGGARLRRLRRLRKPKLGTGLAGRIAVRQRRKAKLKAMENPR